MNFRAPIFIIHSFIHSHLIIESVLHRKHQAGDWGYSVPKTGMGLHLSQASSVLAEQ